MKDTVNTGTINHKGIVQMVEIIVKKVSQPLYQAPGIFLEMAFMGFTGIVK